MTNGNGNGEETKPKRGEDGRFLPGGPGGPGRGKKVYKLDLDNMDSWEGSKQLILQLMSSDNENTRLKATTLYLKWKAMKADFERKRTTKDKVSDLLSPYQMAINKIISAVKRPNQDLLETSERVQKACSNCSKIGKPRRDFGFDNYHADE